MMEYPDLLLRSGRERPRGSRFHPAVLILTPLAAILFQVYVPMFVSYLGYLDLPLLVTVYFSLMRRSPVSGIACGASIGLVQDSLSHQPLGMFGIAKTLVGYFAASLSVRFDLDHPALRLILAFLFFLFHQFLYWLMDRTLLGAELGFSATQTLVLGVMNGLVSLPLFHVLDKLKSRS